MTSQGKQEQQPPERPLSRRAIVLGAVFVLGYLNSRAPAPDPSAPVVGTG